MSEVPNDMIPDGAVTIGDVVECPICGKDCVDVIEEPGGKQLTMYVHQYTDRDGVGMVMGKDRCEDWWEET